MCISGHILTNIGKFVVDIRFMEKAVLVCLKKAFTLKGLP